MTRRRWGLAVLGVAMVGWIIGGEWVSIHARVPENHFIDAMGGLSFLAAGLVALDRWLEDRVCAVRGSFRVQDTPGGTRVLAEIPCDA